MLIESGAEEEKGLDSTHTLDLGWLPGGGAHSEAKNIQRKQLGLGPERQSQRAAGSDWESLGSSRLCVAFLALCF